MRIAVLIVFVAVLTTTYNTNVQAATTTYSCPDKLDVREVTVANLPTGWRLYSTWGASVTGSSVRV